MIKVFISDPLAQEGIDILKSNKEFQVDARPKLPVDELKKAVKDAEVLIVRSETKVTKEIIEAAEKLKIIGRAGVGVDNVDVETASKRGIIVMNAPSGNTISTAEHTMSMILALSRNIPQANATLKSKVWDRKKFMGVELYGKTLGIIGLGRIGQAVAKRSASFGMKIIAYDPFLSAERAKELQVELADLNRLYKESDYITVHTPLSDETKHLISDKQIAMMKDGVRLINCARGGIIDEAALLKGLESKKVAGAALDVFEKEPPLESPLLNMDNVVVTPHLGAATEEAQINVAIDIAKQVIDALTGKGVRNAVNVPYIDPEVYEILAPYFTLGEKMGSFQAQMAGGPITNVKIEYRGDITSHELDQLTVSILKGMLTPFLKETVNFVNAKVLAKERGIRVEEIKSTQLEDFANLISVEVTSDGKKCEIWGTLFAKNDPRIVKVEDFYVEIVPEGYILVAHNYDKPGIIGQIGTILGKNEINIASMTFGRTQKGKDAITVLNVDAAVSPNVLKEIETSKNIKDVKLIKL